MLIGRRSLELSRDHIAGYSMSADIRLRFSLAVYISDRQPAAKARLMRPARLCFQTHYLYSPIRMTAKL